MDALAPIRNLEVTHDKIVRAPQPGSVTHTWEVVVDEPATIRSMELALDALRDCAVPRDARVYILPRGAGEAGVRVIADVTVPTVEL